MATYSPQTWRDKDPATPVSAARLSNMETGIRDASTAAEAAAAEVGQVTTAANSAVNAANDALDGVEALEGRVAALEERPAAGGVTFTETEAGSGLWTAS